VSLTSVADKEFLKTLEHWLSGRCELLVQICYSRAAGSKDFELFTSFAALSERLRRLPPETRVVAFRQPQLPLRGVVDDEFIRKCLSEIRDGSEFLMVETVHRTAGRHSWFHDEAGETHAELQESLEQSRGTPVAVGEYPQWLEDSPDVISAYVPHSDGAVRRGVY
jgi:hypothetical protein